jgi:excisionase family DNA binding protein
VTDRLVDAVAIAELLSVPKTWVLEQARNGSMPCVRLGRYVRFSEADVRKWVDSLKSGGRPAYRKHSPTSGGAG